MGSSRSPCSEGRGAAAGSYRPPAFLVGVSRFTSKHHWWKSTWMFATPFPGAGKGSAWTSAAPTTAWLFPALLDFKS